MSPQNTSRRRVVITGLGCVSPLGHTVQETWANLVEGKSGAANITQFDASACDVHFACEVKNFDASTLVPKKEMRRMDRFIQLGFAAAVQAVNDAKLTEGVIPDPERVAVILSSGMGGLPAIENQYRSVLEKTGRLSPYFIPMVIPNMIAGFVSIQYGYKGPNFSITSACSSSAHAIGEAARMIERSDIDVALAGGSESTISWIGITGFSTMKALSTRNDAPEKASRPFDKDRDGFVMGEGGAVLVIEGLDSAQKRGAKIYAEIVGYAANSDAYHITSPSEGGEGAGRCMQIALKDAGIPVTAVDVINMHGTSTGQGDIAESQAIERLFGDHAKTINCTSSKSMTGHMLGAAGSMEALFSTLYLQDQMVSPTINLDNPDEQCRLNYTAHKAIKRKVDVALSNSFGFGGTNSTLVLKRFT